MAIHRNSTPIKYTTKAFLALRTRSPRKKRLQGKKGHPDRIVEQIAVIIIAAFVPRILSAQQVVAGNK